MSLTTLSFLVSTPGTFERVPDFPLPIPGAAGGLLLKDVFLHVPLLEPSRPAMAVWSLLASESRIGDADMAAEMVGFTRSNILQQAGTSILAQANQGPNSILSLLR